MKKFIEVFVLSFVVFFYLLFVFGYGTPNTVMKGTKMCGILEIAFDEGDFSPSWYTDAAKVLKSCGFVNATVLGEYKSCLAERRIGVVKECEEPEKFILKNK